MADRYPSFAALQAGERDDHYEIVDEDRGTDVLVMAIHGGKIEYHTSLIAREIAGDDHSLYLFEGSRPNSNYDHLHVCSIKFDEPTLQQMLSSVGTCVSIHGKQGDDPWVMVGGRDDELRDSLKARLSEAGFSLRSPKPGYEGKDPQNVCNRTRRNRGAQLEISLGLRARLYEDPRALDRFATAVRGAIEDQD